MLEKAIQSVCMDQSQKCEKNVFEKLRKNIYQKTSKMSLKNENHEKTIHEIILSLVLLEKNIWPSFKRMLSHPPPEYRMVLPILSV